VGDDALKQANYRSPSLVSRESEEDGDTMKSAVLTGIVLIVPAIVALSYNRITDRRKTSVYRHRRYWAAWRTSPEPA
jgi:hypothetical protein